MTSSQCVKKSEIYGILSSATNFKSLNLLLKNGDIIATTTSIDGLDVTHTGYVYKSEGGTYFLHASSKSKEVIVSGEELQEYVASDSKKTGIMVARPLEI